VRPRQEKLKRQSSDERGFKRGIVHVRMAGIFSPLKNNGEPKLGKRGVTRGKSDDRTVSRARIGPGWEIGERSGRRQGKHYLTARLLVRGSVFGGVGPAEEKQVCAKGLQHPHVCISWPSQRLSRKTERKLSANTTGL